VVVFQPVQGYLTVQFNQMPMGRRSTRFKIVFFSVLLAGFIVIQYSWVNSLQKERSREFKSQVISGINEAAIAITSNASPHELTTAAIAGALRRSFSSQGLNDLRFEFSVGSGNHHPASRGFSKKLKDNINHLVLYYEVAPISSSDMWTVVIPNWKMIIWKGLVGIMAALVLLTVMIVTIFWFTIIWHERRQQLFYRNRSNAINNMIRQLETPLSTVSVAAEALRNARVMHDPGKTNYFKQVITEQSQQMNEQVEKIFRELE